MTYEYKAGETYQTRDGRKVRIYATDGGESSTIHGAIRDLFCHWNMALWSKDGQWAGACSEHPCDLMPPKRQVWVAVWLTPGNEHPQTIAFLSEFAAEACATSGSRRRLAVLGPIDVEAEP